MSDPIPDHPEAGAKPEEKEVTSEELFKGQDRLIIDHEGEKYRLTITRNGKLILQK